MSQFRVILNGKGYDLLESFGRARMDDFDALLMATGRNPFAVSSGLAEFDKLRTITDDDARAAALEGEIGNRIVRTITDLVFLAKRDAGEKMTKPDGAVDPDRPITYAQATGSLQFFQVIEAFAAASKEAVAEADPEADPTSARTVSVPGGSTAAA